MTYAAIIDVAAPIGIYDTFHAETIRRGQGRREGLLVHLARSTHTGFQILEVWTSQELCQRYVQEIIIPARTVIIGSAPGQADSLPPEHMEEFYPRGLVIPSAQLIL